MYMQEMRSAFLHGGAHFGNFLLDGVECVSGREQRHLDASQLLIRIGLAERIPGRKRRLQLQRASITSSAEACQRPERVLSPTTTYSPRTGATAMVIRASDFSSPAKASANRNGSRADQSIVPVR